MSQELRDADNALAVVNPLGWSRAATATAAGAEIAPREPQRHEKYAFKSILGVVLSDKGHK